MGYNDKFAIEIIGKYIYMCVHILYNDYSNHWIWFTVIPMLLPRTAPCSLLDLLTRMVVFRLLLDQDGGVCVPGVKRCALSVWCHVESLLDPFSSYIYPIIGPTPAAPMDCTIALLNFSFDFSSSCHSQRRCNGRRSEKENLQ